jgi:FKBP-type peptidyl-prolyl cis-trans isomerase 2
MDMKEGDFLLIDYTGRIAETGEVFDLTDADTAKKEGIFDEKRKYEPVLVVIGAKMVIPGVEEQLKKMKPGEDREFKVAPDMAFGQRNLKLIRIIPLVKFIQKNINPVPGLFVEIDGREAKVQSVGGGRVRVDFNNPLAGKELKYWVKVVRVVKNPLEKAKALFRYYGQEAELKLTESKLVVKTEKKLDDFLKKLLKDAVLRWVKEIKEVEFGEGKISFGDRKV